MKILLVETKFPVPPKNKNHKDIFPIGLLKLAAMYKVRRYRVKLIRDELTKKRL